MAAAEEIASILIDVLEQNLDYCAICLRTSEQRKLIASETFTLFSKKLRLRAPQNKYLCFVCEAHVSRAWRTLHTVLFSANINTWFQGAGRRLGQKRSLKQDLQAVTKMLRFGSDQTLEQFWGEVRERSRLALTEPLVVGSQTIDHPPQNKQGAAPRQDEWQLTMEVGPIVRPLDPLPVVVIEDDEPPKPPPPQLVTIDTFLDNISPNHYCMTADKQQLLTRDKEDTDIIVLYPIVTGTDKNLYVPTLNARINKNDRIDMVPESELTKNIYQSYNYKLKQDFIAIKGDMVKVNVMEIDSDPKVTNVAGLGGMKKEAKGVEKKAVATENKVDWEDKIPMDVISFVDATDPNAEQFISEPFSVHTQSQTKPGSPSPSRSQSPDFEDCWADNLPIIQNQFSTEDNKHINSYREISRSVHTNTDSAYSDSDRETSGSAFESLLSARKKARRSNKQLCLDDSDVVIDLC